MSAQQPEACAGFCLNVSGAHTLYAAYSITGNEVVLAAQHQIAGAPPAIWLLLSTPRSSAVEQARWMVEQMRLFAKRLGGPVRPVEALSLDDFVEHLRLKLEGGFQ